MSVILVFHKLAQRRATCMLHLSIV